MGGMFNKPEINKVGNQQHGGYLLELNGIQAG